MVENLSSSGSISRSESDSNSSVKEPTQKFEQQIAKAGGGHSISNVPAGKSKEIGEVATETFSHIDSDADVSGYEGTAMKLLGSISSDAMPSTRWASSDDNFEGGIDYSDFDDIHDEQEMRSFDDLDDVKDHVKLSESKLESSEDSVQSDLELDPSGGDEIVFLELAPGPGMGAAPAEREELRNLPHETHETVSKGLEPPTERQYQIRAFANPISKKEAAIDALQKHITILARHSDLKGVESEIQQLTGVLQELHGQIAEINDLKEQHAAEAALKFAQEPVPNPKSAGVEVLEAKINAKTELLSTMAPGSAEHTNLSAELTELKQAHGVQSGVNIIFNQLRDITNNFKASVDKDGSKFNKSAFEGEVASYKQAVRQGNAGKASEHARNAFRLLGEATNATKAKYASSMSSSGITQRVVNDLFGMAANWRGQGFTQFDVNAGGQLNLNTLVSNFSETGIVQTAMEKDPHFDVHVQKSILGGLMGDLSAEMGQARDMLRGTSSERRNILNFLTGINERQIANSGLRDMSDQDIADMSELDMDAVLTRIGVSNEYGGIDADGKRTVLSRMKNENGVIGLGFADKVENMATVLRPDRVRLRDVHEAFNNAMDDPKAFLDGNSAFKPEDLQTFHTALENKEYAKLQTAPLKAQEAFFFDVKNQMKPVMKTALRRCVGELKLQGRLTNDEAASLTRQFEQAIPGDSPNWQQLGAFIKDLSAKIPKK